MDIFGNNLDNKEKDITVDVEKNDSTKISFQSPENTIIYLGS